MVFFCLKSLARPWVEPDPIGGVGSAWEGSSAALTRLESTAWAGDGAFRLLADETGFDAGFESGPVEGATPEALALALEESDSESSLEPESADSPDPRLELGEVSVAPRTV